MNMVLTSVLLALNIALSLAAPQNGVTVENDKKAAPAVVGEKTKGDPRGLFSGFETDDETIKACLSGESCEFMTVSDAKALDYNALSSVQAVKAGETMVTKALSPTLATMSESLRSLQAQKALLESLEASMAALTSQSNKGQELAKAAGAQFADTMTKGLVFSPESNKGAALAPPSKGAALSPMSKGLPLPPSKGASMASSINTEAMLCPMTMFELGKCQKLSVDMKVQMDATTSMNAHLLAEKQKLENQLAATQVLLMKAQEQADFNAKYAAEQKAKADMFAVGLNQCTVEKTMVKEQKAALEVQLNETQTALAEEHAKNEALTAELAQCNDDKAELSTALSEQTARADKAESELAETKARLEEEIDRAIGLEESLKFTQNRLARCEDDLKQERTTREQTEEELMKTMTELSSCQKENRVTSEILSRTQDELQENIAALARETAARESLQAKLDTTVQQLRETEQELRDTRRALEDEQNAHTTTKRLLAETEQELENSQAANQALQEANKELTDELAETKAQLEAMTAERNQLQSTLDATSVAYAECTEKKMTCEASLIQQTANAEQLSKQLAEAMMMLKAEKEAREELTATIAMVQKTSMLVQSEVKKLQLENIELQKQVEKLQSEQQVALALAAGCPPTYEKFGSSCYKYVRAKTPWKMAQEQCMKDSGNLIAIESTEEQIFVTDYLKRHGATDAYSYTSGNKQINGWKWLGASNNHMGASGVEFWYNMVTKQKPGYDCQALYLYDRSQHGKWVGLPCYTAAPYVCEYNLIPHGQITPNNDAEKMAILKMAEDAPYYLKNLVRLRS